MKLIDADALPQQPQPLPPPNIPVCDAVGPYGAGLICGARAVVQMIREAPTVDPESLRPHGRWEEIHEEEGHWYGTCTHCHHIRAIDDYCSNCGANMEKEEGYL